MMNIKGLSDREAPLHSTRDEEEADTERHTGHSDDLGCE